MAKTDPSAGETLKRIANSIRTDASSGHVSDGTMRLRLLAHADALLEAADQLGVVPPAHSAIRWVKQDDPCGCALACLAMATGQTYAEVRSAWPEEFNFRTGGITHEDVTHYLGDRFIPYQLRYRFELGRNGVGLDGKDERVIRADWPQPFAPVHILGLSSGRHDVVLLADGTVLDPMQEAPRHLRDIGEVAFMIGVWPSLRLPTNTQKQFAFQAAGDVVPPSPASDLPLIRKRLQWVRKFIEYARYELQPGEQQSGDQFPRQSAADKAMREIDDVLSELASCAPRPAGGWHPIETAKRGDPLLLADDHGERYVGRWDLARGAFGRTDSWLGWVPATHWQPLPPLPAPPSIGVPPAASGA